MPDPTLDEELLKRSDPQAAWQKAESIGAPGIGSHYLPTEGPKGILDIVRMLVGGNEMPRSVQAQDPYGTEAYLQGKGPMPGLMMGSMIAEKPSPLGDESDAALVLSNFLNNSTLPEVTAQQAAKYGRTTGTVIPDKQFLKIPSGLTFDEGTMTKLKGNRPAWMLEKRHGQQRVFKQLAEENASLEGGREIPRVKSGETLQDLTPNLSGPSKPTPLAKDNPRAMKFKRNETAIERATRNTSARRKLTVDMVKDIKNMQKAGKSITEVHSKYPDINFNTFGSVWRGDSWNSVKPD